MRTPLVFTRGPRPAGGVPPGGKARRFRGRSKIVKVRMKACAVLLTALASGLVWCVERAERGPGAYSAAGEAARSRSLRAGYGRAVVTPPLGTPCALGLDDELVEVFDDLYVRALYLDCGAEKALVLAADLIEIARSDGDELTREVAKAVGMPASRIILHTTHTHQTANSRWEDSQALKPYGLSEAHSSSAFKSLLSKGLVDAARRAVAGAEECEMTYAESEVRGIASNRRIQAGDGSRVIFRSSRPPEEIRRLPEGPIDPLLRLVLFRSRTTGRMIGICNYSCHPSAAGGDEGPYATGDFPGRGMALAENQIDNLKLIHLTGTCGEINPGKHVLSDSPDPDSRKRDVELMGERYAAAIVSAVRMAEKRASPANPAGLAFARSAVSLPMRRDLASEAELSVQLEDMVKIYQKNKDSGEQRPRENWGILYRLHSARHTKNGRQETEAAALRLGDVFLTFIPGEISLRLGEGLRARFGRYKLLNVSCSIDGGISYVIPPEYFPEGGYEPTATDLAPEAYDVLLSHMATLLQKAGS